jgi:UPF0716 protein FxsA
MFARLLLLFIVVPLVELFLLIKVGTRIGLWPTLGIVVVTAFIGAALTRMQGAATMLKAQAALREGRMPHAEVLDGLMIVLAGAVLLTPGFLTDAFGFSLLIPPVRAAVRKKIAAAFRKRVRIISTVAGDASLEGGSSRRWTDDDNVIDVEAVDADS